MGIGYFEALLGICLVSLRLFAVATGVSHVKWDFAWSAAAIVFAVAGHIFYTLGVLNGIGNGTANVSLDNILAVTKWLFVYVPLALVAATCAKFAIIALLLEHNPDGPHARYRRWTLWSIGFLTMTTSIIAAIIGITACEPISKSYDFTSPGTCPRTPVAVKFSYVQSGMSALMSKARNNGLT